jgi:hypothetical protein
MSGVEGCWDRDVRGTRPGGSGCRRCCRTDRAGLLGQDAPVDANLGVGLLARDQRSLETVARIVTTEAAGTLFEEVESQCTAKHSVNDGIDTAEAGTWLVNVCRQFVEGLDLVDHNPGGRVTLLMDLSLWQHGAQQCWCPRLSNGPRPLVLHAMRSANMHAGLRVGTAG